MAKCYYPFCYRQAMWQPVVEIPTVRTKGDGVSDELSPTDRPTYIVFNAICDMCKCNRYTVNYWITSKDWRDIREEAKRRGFTIPPMHLIQVAFKPLDWTPHKAGYMEMDRK